MTFKVATGVAPPSVARVLEWYDDLCAACDRSCVVLVGIVVNDAIIKVEFINQRRAAGMALREAVMAAGRDRVRPILMTTITTVLGLLPLTLGFGEGAELRAPLAIAIVGGLTSATLLTLLVVPVLYTLIARK